MSTEVLEDRTLLSGESFDFVDIDNDGLFNGADVDVTAEVADGKFDTAVSEGAYTAVADAGLVINNAIVADSVDLTADRNLIIDANLTSTNRHIDLTSRTGNVELDDPTLTAADKVRIGAGLDFLSTDDTILAENDVKITAGRDLTGVNITIDGGPDSNDHVKLTAGRNLTIGSAVSTGGYVKMNAGVDIDVRDANILSEKRSVKLKAGGSVLADGAVIAAERDVGIKGTGGDVDINSARISSANADVEVDAGNNINGSGVTIDAGPGARDDVELTAGNNITIASEATAGGDVEMEAGGDIDVRGATIVSEKDDVELTAGGAVLASDAVIAAERDVEIETTVGDIIVHRATITSANADVELHAGRDALGSPVTLEAGPGARDEVIVTAGNDIILVRL